MKVIAIVRAAQATETAKNKLQRKDADENALDKSGIVIWVPDEERRRGWEGVAREKLSVNSRVACEQKDFGRGDFVRIVPPAFLHAINLANLKKDLK